LICLKMHIHLYQLRPLVQGLLDCSQVLHEENALLICFDLSQRVFENCRISALAAEFYHVASGALRQYDLESPSFQQLLDQVPLARGSEDDAQRFNCISTPSTR
jgi:hypothetical protein